MAINRNEITDINSAKQLKYDGQDLTAGEKAIFDNLFTNQSFDLGKTQDTAELLETVIMAKKATEFKRDLHEKLNEANTKYPDSVTAINTNGNQFTEALNHQISLRTKTPQTPTQKNEAWYEGEIKKLEGQIANLDVLIDDEAKLIDLSITQAAIHRRKLQEIKKNKELIQDFKNLLEGKTLDEGRPLHRSTAIDLTTATNILRDMKNDMETAMNKKIVSWKTNLRSYYSGREYMNKTNLMAVNRQIMDIFKEIGDAGMKTAINKHVTTNKARALELWEGKSGVNPKVKPDDIGLIDRSEWGVMKLTEDNSSHLFNLRRYNEDLTRDGKMKGKEAKYSEISLYADGNNPADVKANWPFLTFNDDNFLEFMEIVFPRSTYSEDSSSFSSNALTKELGGNKTWQLNFLGFSDDVFGKSNKTIKEFKMREEAKKLFGANDIKELTAVLTPALHLRSVVGLFWDIYTPAILGTPGNRVTLDSQLTLSEINLNNAKAEINFIKAVRASGISKEEISDEIVMKVSARSVVHLNYLNSLDEKKNSKELPKDSDFFKKYGMTSYENETKHFLSDKSVNYTVSNFTQNSGDWRDYVDTVPLADEISRLEIEESREEVKEDKEKGIITRLTGKQADYEVQKRDLQHQLSEFKKQLTLIKTGDIDKLKKEFRESYAVAGLKTRPQLDTLMVNLNRIDEIEKQQQKAKGEAEVGLVDQDLKDAKKALEDLNNDLSLLEAQMGNFRTYGKTSKERALNKTLNNSQLTGYKNAYEAAKLLRKLSEGEDSDLKAIEAKLAGTLKDDTPTSSDLDPTKLTSLFGFTVDQTLADTWKNFAYKILTEAEIKKIFIDTYAPNKSGHNGLLSHLNERGDVDKDKDYKVSSDSDKAASWQKLIKKGPEKVIKTIVIHENDDAFKDNPDKNKIKEIMKKMRNSSHGWNDERKQNKFNWEKYGDPTEGNEDKMERDKLLAFLYDEKLNKVSQRSTTWDTDSPSEETPGVWARFKNHMGANWYWYALATVAIIALVFLIFWKQISNWWNGPAEEEGTTAQDKEGEEGENEESEE